MAHLYGCKFGFLPLLFCHSLLGRSYLMLNNSDPVQNGSASLTQSRTEEHFTTGQFQTPA